MFNYRKQRTIKPTVTLLLATL